MFAQLRYNRQCNGEAIQLTGHSLGKTMRIWPLLTATNSINNIGTVTSDLHPFVPRKLGAEHQHSLCLGADADYAYGTYCLYIQTNVLYSKDAALMTTLVATVAYHGR